MSKELKRGDKGNDVIALHDFLFEFGYLPNLKLKKKFPSWVPAVFESPASPDRFDTVIEQALMIFQRIYKLPQTGTLNDETRILISAPRCGVPDSPLQMLDNAPFRINGKWAQKKITSFPSLIGRPIPRYITRQQFSNIVLACRNSFNAESAKCKFVPSRDQFPNINYAFSRKNEMSKKHLGICYYHTENRTKKMQMASIQINSDFLWRVDNNGNPYDLHSVFLHELGHAIGLGHSDLTSAVMYPSIPANTSKRNFAAPDIAGIDFLYG